MEKTIYTKDYATFLRCLRKARRDACLTQAQLADRIHQTQSFVSKCERGERRLDVIEVRDFCQAIGIALSQFVEHLEVALRTNPNS